METGIGHRTNIKYGSSSSSSELQKEFLASLIWPLEIMLFQSLARKTFSNAVRTARPTMPAFQSFRFMTTGDGEESPTRPTVGDVQLLPRHVSGELDTVGKKKLFFRHLFLYY